MELQKKERKTAASIRRVMESRLDAERQALAALQTELLLTEARIVMILDLLATAPIL